MRVSLKLQESTKEIEKLIVRALHQEVASLLVRTAESVGPKIQSMVKRRIMAQPEVESLINGKLKAEFGIPDGQQRIESIVDFWCKGLRTEFKKRNQFGTQFNYEFTITMIPSDYREAISLAEANVRISDGSLPWLEWLLKFGDKIIVRNFDVRFTKQDEKSRTGLAVMVEGPNRQWGVPPEFAGTEDNNFVTRALVGADEEILHLLEDTMKAEL